MRVLLDVGNTSITYGIEKNGRLSHHNSCLIDDIPKNIKKNAHGGVKIKKIAVISSVVPKNTKKLASFFKKEGYTLLIAGQNLPVPVKHRYKKPKKLGIDRLVNIYGASRMHKTPLLVMDFGTAVTADYVSAKGVFEGGMIIPGPELGFRALIQRAAMIPPKARLPVSTSGFLGTDTRGCMASGILEGYSVMTDGLILRFRKRYSGPLRVILTGGFVRHLAPYLMARVISEPLLALKSLSLLADQATPE